LESVEQAIRQSEQAPQERRSIEATDLAAHAGAAAPEETRYRALTAWDISNALLEFHLSRADADAGIDGIAYPYGRNGMFPGLTLDASQERIGAANFASEAQTLRQFEGLREGLVSLA
jgi:hypothetical protein